MAFLGAARRLVVEPCCFVCAVASQPWWRCGWGCKKEDHPYTYLSVLPAVPGAEEASDAAEQCFAGQPRKQLRQAGGYGAAMFAARTHCTAGCRECCEKQRCWPWVRLKMKQPEVRSTSLEPMNGLAVCMVAWNLQFVSCTETSCHTACKGSTPLPRMHAIMGQPSLQRPSGDVGLTSNDRASSCKSCTHYK